MSPTEDGRSPSTTVWLRTAHKTEGEMAITVKNARQVVNYPVAPCGICRQRILEYELRFSNDIEILMMGEEGEIYSVNSVKDLLPLYFSKSVL